MNIPAHYGQSDAESMLSFVIYRDCGAIYSLFLGAEVGMHLHAFCWPNSSTQFLAHCCQQKPLFLEIPRRAHVLEAYVMVWSS